MTTTIEQRNTRLRRARHALDLTQGDLAAAVGCSRVSISNIEAGRQRPKLPLARAIAGRLGVTTDALFADDDAQDVRRGGHMPEVTTVDPVEFVTRALDSVPDPADATFDDLDTLGAIAAGVHAGIADGYRRTLALGRAAVNGDISAEEARRELAWLVALGVREEQAREQLATYLHAATVALGVEGAWQAAGVAPPTPSKGTN